MATIGKTNIQIKQSDLNQAIIRKNKSLETKNKWLESSIGDKENAIKELDGKAKSCNAEIKSLIKIIEDEKKSLVSQKNKVYKVEDEVSKIASKVSILKKDESSLDGSISKLEGDKKILVQDVAYLGFQKKEAERLLSEVNSIEIDKASKTKELESLHENYDNLLDSLHTLEENHESMGLKYKEELEEASDILHQRINEYKEKEDELKSFQKTSDYKIKVLKEDVKDMQDELSGVQSLVNKTEDEVINWRKKVEVEKNRVEEEKKNITRVKENFSKWKIGILEDVAIMKLKNKIDNIDKAGLSEILNG